MLFGEPIHVSVLVILALAALVRSTFGFADALMAMPLLSMLVGVEMATPLVALAAMTTGLVILLADWRRVRFHAAKMLVLGSLCGIPFGVLLLKRVPDVYVKSLLAAVTTSFAIYGLARPRLIQLAHDRWAALFGLCAGVLGGAYNTQGPPLVIYGTLREWPPDEFRATLQGCLLPSGLGILLAHYLGDLWTPRVLSHFVASIPVVLLAIPIGRWLNRRLPQGNFSKLVYVLLLAVGAVLLLNTLLPESETSTPDVPTNSVPAASVPTNSVPTNSVPTNSVPTNSVPTNSARIASAPPDWSPWMAAWPGSHETCPR